VGVVYKWALVCLRRGSNPGYSRADLPSVAPWLLDGIPGVEPQNIWAPILIACLA